MNRILTIILISFVGLFNISACDDSVSDDNKKTHSPDAPSVYGIINGSFNTDQYFILVGEEGAVLEYSLDGGYTWQNYTHTVNLSNEGVYTVVVRQIVNNIVSNQSESIEVVIDKSLPDGPVIDDIEDGIYNSEQHFVITGEIGATIEYTIDGGMSWNMYDDVVTINEEGDYTIAARQRDLAGNISSVSTTYDVTIDMSEPGNILVLAADPGGKSVTLSWTEPDDNDFTKVMITFMPTSTSVSQPIEVMQGTTSIKITPLETGQEYTFTLVSCDEAGNNSNGTTATATPAGISYTVTFNAQLGSSVEPMIVEDGDTFEEPTEPTRTTFTFNGWYEEAGCINSWDFMADTVTEDITLYAKWQWSMISVPGGTFTRYADFDWDGDVGDANESVVTAIASFDMAQYQVTYELWYTVYQWAITHGYTFANYGTEGSSASAATSSIAPSTRKYEPVTRVNWRDAIVWCNAFSEMEGYAAVYKNVSDAIIKDASNTSVCDSAIQDTTANGYRLPSLGEWKYAAGYIDGTNFSPWTYASGDSASYDTSTTIGDYAWYVDNSDGITHDVGQKYPNALNIYDMSGNAWEWCFDWHPLQVGTGRCREGGGWGSIAKWLILGDGYYSVQSLADPYLGFRVARSVD